MAALASLGPGTNTLAHSSPDPCLILVVCATQPGWKGSLLPPRSCVRPERATNPSELSIAGERTGTEEEAPPFSRSENYFLILNVSHQCADPGLRAKRETLPFHRNTEPRQPNGTLPKSSEFTSRIRGGKELAESVF